MPREYRLSDGSTVIEAGRSRVADESSIRIIQGPPLIGPTTERIVDFRQGGLYQCNVTGACSLDISTLGIGQKGILHLYSKNSNPEVIINHDHLNIRWINGSPTFTDGSCTAINLFNNGSEIIADFVVTVNQGRMSLIRPFPGMINQALTSFGYLDTRPRSDGSTEAPFQQNVIVDDQGAVAINWNSGIYRVEAPHIEGLSGADPLWLSYYDYNAHVLTCPEITDLRHFIMPWVLVEGTTWHMWAVVENMDVYTCDTLVYFTSTDRGLTWSEGVIVSLPTWDVEGTIPVTVGMTVSCVKVGSIYHMLFTDGGRTCYKSSIDPTDFSGVAVQALPETGDHKNAGNGTGLYYINDQFYVLTGANDAEGNNEGVVVYGGSKLTNLSYVGTLISVTDLGDDYTGNYFPALTSYRNGAMALCRAGSFVAQYTLPESQIGDEIYDANFKQGVVLVNETVNQGSAGTKPALVEGDLTITPKWTGKQVLVAITVDVPGFGVDLTAYDGTTLTIETGGISPNADDVADALNSGTSPAHLRAREDFTFAATSSTPIPNWNIPDLHSGPIAFPSAPSSAKQWAYADLTFCTQKPFTAPVDVGTIITKSEYCYPPRVLNVGDKYLLLYYKFYDQTMKRYLLDDIRDFELKEASGTAITIPYITGLPKMIYRDGVVFAIANATINGNNCLAWFRSDDLGLTWTEPEPIELPGTPPGQGYGDAWDFTWHSDTNEWGLWCGFSVADADIIQYVKSYTLHDFSDATPFLSCSIWGAADITIPIVTAWSGNSVQLAWHNGLLIVQDAAARMFRMNDNHPSQLSMALDIGGDLIVNPSFFNYRGRLCLLYGSTAKACKMLMWL